MYEELHNNNYIAGFISISQWKMLIRQYNQLNICIRLPHTSTSYVPKKCNSQKMRKSFITFFCQFSIEDFCKLSYTVSICCYFGSKHLKTTSLFYFWVYKAVYLDLKICMWKIALPYSNYKVNTWNIHYYYHHPKQHRQVQLQLYLKEINTVIEVRPCSFL